MIEARPRLFFHRRFESTSLRMPHDLTSRSQFGQLPSKITPFVGRQSAIQFLRDRFEQAAPSKVVISGEAGIGKTALAIEVAHRDFKVHYYANFRGSDVEPLDLAIVLTRWLRTSGERAIFDEKADFSLRLQRFQTLLDQQQTAPILVLDDIQNETQVEPFLELNCAVLITSRKALSIEGLINFELSELEESLTLLRQQIGFAAIAAEPEASDNIVQHCDRVPLAIELASAAINQSRSLKEFETQLSKQKPLTNSTLNQSVHLLFELNYQTLSPTAAKLLQLLSLLVENQFTPTLAATLLQSSEAITIDAINQLVALKFVNAIDAPNYRFTHDLIRLYARQRLSVESTIDQRQAARLLVCRWYLEQIESIHLTDQTMNWFEAERLNLLIAIEWAEQAQEWELVVRLVNSIAEFLDECGDQSHGRTVLRSAIAASKQLNDPFYQAATLNNLGNLELRQQQWKQARSYYEQSLEIFSQLNDASCQAKTLVNLGILDALQKQPTTAASQWKAALKLLGNTEATEQVAVVRSMQAIDLDLLKAAGGTVNDSPPASGFFQNFTQKLKRLLK